MNICTGPLLLSVFKRPMYSIWVICHSFHTSLYILEMSPGLSVVSVLKVGYMYGALPLVALCTICVIIAFRCWSVPQRRYCTMIRALQLYSPGAASGPLARRSWGSHRAPRV